MLFNTASLGSRVAAHHATKRDFLVSFPWRWRRRTPTSDNTTIALIEPSESHVSACVHELAAKCYSPWIASCSQRSDRDQDSWEIRSILPLHKLYGVALFLQSWSLVTLTVVCETEYLANFSNGSYELCITSWPAIVSALFRWKSEEKNFTKHARKVASASDRCTWILSART